MTPIEFFVLLAAAACVIALQIATLWRGRGGAGNAPDAALWPQLQQLQQHSLERIDRVEREVRMQLQTSAQATRQELSAALAQFHAATVQQLDGMRAQIQGQGQSGRE